MKEDCERLLRNFQQQQVSWSERKPLMNGRENKSKKEGIEEDDEK